MKTIGLIGGLSYLSTLDYYRLLNEMVNERVGGVASAKIYLYSVDFSDIKRFTEQQDWESIADIICPAAKKIQAAGADCLLVCANTMHHIADKIQNNLSIPLIHIAEATAKVVANAGIKKVALLGTKYTMQLDFYKNKLTDAGITTMIPSREDIEIVNKAIYEEMGKGIFTHETKNRFLHIINKLQNNGAEGVILGCTEIPILIKQEDICLPAFDTTRIHATAAVNFVLNKE
jgi:aspartate racemase